ncbi:MAG: hypothetical protein II494_05155 [Bacilli bacterium]|nr:hypothetical protein [Bacilli bacterium]
MTNRLDSEKKYLFESAPVFKAIFSLALPSIIGQLILVIYNMTDTFFIGQASRLIDPSLSSELVAGVTICMPIYMIISAISNLFGIGASSVISRSLGVGREERAKNSSRFAFWSCLITTIIYCLLVLLVSGPISMFLSGGAPETARFAREYILYCVVIFGVPTALNTLFSHLLRAQGKSLQASIGIAVGGILNCVLDPLFMFVLFPIEKAAVAASLATGVANTIALLYYAVLFIRGKKTLVISLKLSPKAFKDGIPGEVLRVGTPACLMTLCENVSYMILDNLVGTAIIAETVNEETLATSASALAGVGVAKKINMLAHSIVRGMTQGVLPLIGYSKSHGDRKRMARVVYTSGAISVAVASLCMVASLIWAEPLSMLFVHERDSVSRSMEFLRILCVGAPFSAVAYTAISFFQAVGKAGRSFILALLRKGILDIPLMYLFYSVSVVSSNPYGPELIVFATPIADAVCCVVAIILFSFYLRPHKENRVVASLAEAD